MWLLTRHGFYSLTRSTDEPDKLQVRALLPAPFRHLPATHYPLLATSPKPGLTGLILETPTADYRWRKGVLGGTGRANGSEKRGSAKAAVLEVGDTPIPTRPTPAQPRLSLSPKGDSEGLLHAPNTPAIVTPAAAETITRCLTHDITYSNFKSTVARQPDQSAKLTGLHDIWELHHGWQDING
jgi:hypothetical protein